VSHYQRVCFTLEGAGQLSSLIPICSLTQIRDWIETTESDDVWIGRSAGSGACKFLPLSASSDQLLLGNILAIIAATVLGSCCPSVPSSV